MRKKNKQKPRQQKKNKKKNVLENYTNLCGSLKKFSYSKRVDEDFLPQIECSSQTIFVSPVILYI